MPCWHMGPYIQEALEPGRCKQPLGTLCQELAEDEHSILPQTGLWGERHWYQTLTFTHREKLFEMKQPPP